MFSDEQPMIRLRRAFRTFLIERMGDDLERGIYDRTLRMFIEGRVSASDTIELNFTVQTIPNDIIVFRELAGFERDQSVIDRVKAMWGQETKRWRFAHGKDRDS